MRLSPRYLLSTSLSLLLSAALTTGCSSDSTDDGSASGTDGTTADVAQTSDTSGTTGTDGTDSMSDTVGGDAATDGTEADTSTADAGDTAEPIECPPQTGQRPGALSEHAGIFDPVSERIVFNGGNPEFPVQCQGKNSYVSETWVYYPRCGVWTTIDGGPPERGRSSAIYDAQDHAMILFGGRFREKGADPFTTPYTLYNEVWRLDLQSDTWTQAATAGTSPSARVNASAIYDPQGHRLVLFGGNTSTSGASYIPQNDVWSLDLETFTWTQLNTTGAPSARLFAAAVYDSKRHAMVVTQGGDANAFLGPFLGDTWSLDLATMQWTQLHPGLSQPPSPDRRIWGRALYHEGLDRLLLFGGHDDGNLGNRNDFWMFSLTTNTWQAVALNDTFNKPGAGFCDFPSDFATIADGTPERRGSHLFVYWPAENQILIHGGKTDCGLIDDLWTYDLDDGTWYDLEPATVGESCLRYADPSQCSSHCN